jgi:hypothetical protein
MVRRRADKCNLKVEWLAGAIPGLKRTRLSSD